MGLEIAYIYKLKIMKTNVFFLSDFSNPPPPQHYRLLELSDKRCTSIWTSTQDLQLFRDHVQENQSKIGPCKYRIEKIPSDQVPSKLNDDLLITCFHFHQTLNNIHGIPFLIKIPLSEIPSIDLYKKLKSIQKIKDKEFEKQKFALVYGNNSPPRYWSDSPGNNNNNSESGSKESDQSSKIDSETENPQEQQKIDFSHIIRQLIANSRTSQEHREAKYQELIQTTRENGHLWTYCQIGIDHPSTKKRGNGKVGLPERGVKIIIR